MYLLKIVKSFFLVGLYIILPIVLTVYILKFLSSLLLGCLEHLRSDITFMNIFNVKYGEIITLLIITFFIGAIISILSLEKIIFTIEKRIIKNIPIVSSIYLGIKKITQILKIKKNPSKEESVVWVRMGNKDTYVIGLMINKVEEKNKPEDKDFYSIFIPTTPNPMTGYYVIVTKDNFIYNSMSREEAISMIISGGIIRPE